MQVVKIEGHEADDVVATLVGQVLQRAYKVVIASPDKDFKQLISEDVQVVLPIKELKRWSFYTVKHYTAQYSCDPCSDLSLSKCEKNFPTYFIFLEYRKNVVGFALWSKYILCVTIHLHVYVVSKYLAILFSH